MKLADSIEKIDSATQKHGLPVVLTLLLLSALLYFAWSQNNYLRMQDETWKQTQQLSIETMRQDLQAEREFNRKQLLETIDNNSEALRELTEQLRHPKL